MGRKHTFMDHEFRREDYDPYDQGDYITNLVFVAMAFSGQESDEIYSAIKDECSKLNLQTKRVDERLANLLKMQSLSFLTLPMNDQTFIMNWGMRMALVMSLWMFY